jgi:hypothetical protein
MLPLGLRRTRQHWWAIKVKRALPRQSSRGGADQGTPDCHPVRRAGKSRPWSSAGNTYCYHKDPTVAPLQQQCILLIADRFRAASAAVEQQAAVSSTPWQLQWVLDRGRAPDSLFGRSGAMLERCSVAAGRDALGRAPLDT